MTLDDELMMGTETPPTYRNLSFDEWQMDWRQRRQEVSVGDEYAYRALQEEYERVMRAAREMAEAQGPERVGTMMRIPVRTRRMMGAFVREGEMPGLDWGEDVTKVKARPPKRPKPSRTEAETKEQFQNLLQDSGLKKKLTPYEYMLHEAKLGPLEEYTLASTEEMSPDKCNQQKEKVNVPKRICPICGHPLCPWSD